MPKLPALISVVVIGVYALHAQWIEQKSGTKTDLTSIVAPDSATAFAVGRDGSILKTTDAGQTWINLPLAPLFFHPWNAVSFTSARSGVVAGDFGRVATTSDGGDTWSWHEVPGGRNCVSVLQIAPASIYVGDDSGRVHHSVDTGVTWSSEHISPWPIRSLFAWTGPYVLGLPLYALTPNSLFSNVEVPLGFWDETVLQAFQGLGSEAFRGVFCNGGGAGFIVGVQGDLRAAPAIVRKSLSDSLWRTVCPGLSGEGTLLGVSAPSDKRIYACGDRGMMFQSSDGGDSWYAAPVPTTHRLRAISFSDEWRGFAVGDSGTILYTSNGGTTSVRTMGDLVPTHPFLFQNYPNPFNSATTIEFRIADWGLRGGGKGQVTLKVYDVLGREAAVLVNEKKAPGCYEVKFDGSGLSSGVYFYRLTAGQYVECRKMVLMK